MDRPITDADVSSVAAKTGLPLELVQKNAAEIDRVKLKYGYKDLVTTLLNWCRRDALKIVQRATFTEPAPMPQRDAFDDSPTTRGVLGRDVPFPCLCYAHRNGLGGCDWKPSVHHDDRHATIQRASQVGQP